jgi:general secretion pathway protein I
MAAKSSSRGFTVLEVLVALAILGSAFTVLLVAHASAVRVEGSAQRLMTGTLLAREILTRTETEGPPEFGGDSGDFGESFPGYTWERTVQEMSLPVDLPLSVSVNNLKEIHIAVSWPERGQTNSVDLVYYALVP